jgi:tRNA nucleotidyltransferase/poly(A) polymerase
VDVVDAGRRGLRDDLLRRELTINAMAFDLDSGKVEDPLGGLRDLRRGLLRMPRPGVIREDPVRALRAARFLAQIPRTRLERETREEVSRAARALRRASPERIRDEIDAILRAPDPGRGFEALVELGLLDAVLPELAPMRRCPAGEGRPDAWRHTLLALAKSARPGRLPAARSTELPETARVLRWALLLHDMAKPATLRSEGDRPTFHGHESLGARRAAALLDRLRLPVGHRRRVTRLILFHLRPHHLAEAGAPDRGMRRLVREAGDDLPLLVLHAACDAAASGAPDATRRWRRLRPVLVRLLALHARARALPPARLVDGDDVMKALRIPPGPEVGRLLAEIRDLQEEGRLLDREDALRHLAERRE